MATIVTTIGIQRIAILLESLLMVTGCMVKPYVLIKDDIQTRATKDLQALTTIQEPVTSPLDLYEALARSLTYNLDARVRAMQTQLAYQQLNIAHYTLLPQVSANAGFDGRSNFSGGVAQSLVTGRQVLESFTSADKNMASGNLALSWDVLDFGLSFVRAQQGRFTGHPERKSTRKFETNPLPPSCLISSPKNPIWLGTDMRKEPLQLLQ